MCTYMQMQGQRPRIVAKQYDLQGRTLEFAKRVRVFFASISQKNEQ
jgi:hypothetical protein